MDPATLASLAGPVLGGLAGKGGSTRVSSTSQATLNASINPTIANVFGGGGVNPYTYGPATGSPSASAATQGDGQTPSFLPRGNANFPATNGRGYAVGPNGQPIGTTQGGGFEDLIILGMVGVGLYFLMQDT
jgi:hypothetical protein